MAGRVTDWDFGGRGALTCDAGEVMGTVRSEAADLLRFVGSRSSSEEPTP